AWTKRNLIFVIAQHRVPFVWPFTILAGRLSAERDYGDLACAVEFNARNTHTRRSHGPDRSGHIFLPECGGRARHGDYREVCLSVIAASATRTDSAPESTFSIRSARPSRRRRAST